MVHTMMQQTSLMAYNDIKPELGHKQAQVYQMLAKLGIATNYALAVGLKWPINTITPRIYELRKLGIVKMYGVVAQETGRNAIAWCLTEAGETNGI